MSRKLVRLIGFLTLASLLVSACQSRRNTTPPQPVGTRVPPTAMLPRGDIPFPSATPTIPPAASLTASPMASAPVVFVDSGQDLGQGDGVAVVVGDVDVDGDQDALISYTDIGSSLLLNDGAGNFTPSRQVFESSTNAALGDLNGDEAADIFFTGEKRNEVWLNDGKGVFSNSSQELITLESSSIALGDLDGDGDLDAFITNWNNHPDQVFLNDGNGNFSDSGQRLGNWFGYDVALGDVDQDGDLDALVANNGEASDNATVLWLNDGTGKFSDSNQRLGFTNAYAVALGDLDNDGDLDAFIANSSHRGADPADKVWLNDGKGVFLDSGQSLGTFYSLIVVLGDLDNDNDLDAFTGSWKVSARFWVNDGKGNFSDARMKIYSSNNAGAAIADMDADGDLDIFVSTNTWNGGDGRPKLWLNQLETME